MLDRLQPGHTDKTYLSIHLFVFELLWVDFRKYVFGQVVSELVSLFVVRHEGLRLFESIAELLAVAADDLLMKDELSREVRSAFDGNGRLHQHPAKDMLVCQRVKI